MHSQRVWLIGLLLVGGTTPEVRACVCSSQIVNDREAAAQQFQAATVVFEGEVVLVSMPTRSGGSGSGEGVSEITLRVIRSYKGSQADSMVLYDGAAETDCGFGARPGEKLFVYGFAGKDGKIYLQACGRSAGLEQAAADLRFARGEQPTPEDLSPPGERLRLYSDPSLAKRGATLSGSVRRSDGGTVSGVFLTVWDVDEKGRREAHMAATQKVNSDGTFDVRYLAPRKYFVTAVDFKWDLIRDSSVNMDLYR